MANLLEHANPEQLAAITHREGPLMIVAGAGTGKTSVITQRIAWLIEQGLAKPEQILALTFTDKAAGEMEERVDLLLPFGYVDLQISTFHAFCEKLLRAYGAEIGLSRDFTLMPELDAWLLARQQVGRFALDHYRPLGNPTKFLRALLAHFSRCKDLGVTPEAYRAFVERRFPSSRGSAGGDAIPSPPDGSRTAPSSARRDEEESERKRLSELANAYAAYQSVLQEHDAVDFGDVMMYALDLLRRRPRVLADVRERYRFVLVDEFQDTNAVQYELVKLIAAPRDNLTVVGDDDQAIYAFRGASLANILRFQTDFPTAEKIVLTRNYRSGQAILDTAHRLIQANNPHRLEAQDERLSKRLVSQREGRGSVEHLPFASLEDEAVGVANRILALKEAHPDAAWSDFCILVRANDAADAFLGPLERAGIPFRFLALSGLYAKRALLDVLAFLRVIDNPFDGPSFYRLLAMPLHGVPADAVARLSHVANRKGKSLGEAAAMGRAAGAVQGEAADRVEGLLAFLARMRAEATRRPIGELYVLVAKESGYLAWLNGRGEREKRDEFNYLQQFYQRVKRFEERHDHPVLRHFLEEFAFERDAGEDGALVHDVEAGPDVVHVMTVHASKGLEFRFVFVVSMVDRRFPSQARAEAIPLPEGLEGDEGSEGVQSSAERRAPSAADPATAHLEEERRLFYVAATRAKEALFLTWAEDYRGTRKRKPSRFLTELGYQISPSSSREAAGDDAILQPDGSGTASSRPPGGGTRDDEQEDHLVIQIPKQFSFTQLVAFASCPLQYEFAHVLKIPVFGKRQMSFGKTMHNTLQHFFERWLERTGARQANLFDAAAAVFPPAPSADADGEAAGRAAPVSLEELEALYAEHWIDDWYPDDAAREEYRAQGLASLRAYYARVKKAPPDVLALEQSFTLKIGDVALKGRIDRIDRCGDGVEIIDYKTGTPKTEADLKKDRGKREQLYLYQLAAGRVLGMKVEKLTFHYLEDDSTVSFLGTPDDLLTLEEDIAERVGRIKRGVFDPTPGYHCRHCDFKDVCEFRAKE